MPFIFIKIVQIHFGGNFWREYVELIKIIKTNFNTFLETAAADPNYVHEF